jgi:C4-type Zn-finger protein
MGGFAASPARACILDLDYLDIRPGDGGAVSTVIENLLSRKQKLVEQLEKAQSVEDRDKIEHQLEQINTALDFLDRPGSRDAR